MEQDILEHLTEMFGSEEKAIQEYDGFVAHLKAENQRWLNERYKIERKNEYPDIGEQLDALYHAGVFPSEMAAQIQAVKEAYPKPSEE